jgi:hypothetical protein
MKPSVTSSCDLAICSEPEEENEFFLGGRESEDEADAVCLYYAKYFSEGYNSAERDSKNILRGHTLFTPTRAVTCGKCKRSFAVATKSVSNSCIL